MLDVRSAVCGLEKMLKTGIVAASSDSNVQSSTTFSSWQILPLQQELHVATSAFDKILNMAAQGLKEHCLSERPLVSNPDVACVAMIGGYIGCVASEHIPCADCVFYSDQKAALLSMGSLLIKTVAACSIQLRNW
ncbi:hypothetical protein HPB49_022918 [Dermacentor silvarum]|uniref:Uncharacterized protein n=1 Tax=Dermacentor silvarum TaxID=543639 RepID=A0ACB8DS72_DERSI|nr:hypothetical protein HPB49_022918 [Dermacentor silvarum]